MSEKAVLHCHGLGCDSTALIEAHVIPAGFARFVKQTGPNIRISPESVGRAKQQLGEFDPEILCGPCDNKLGLFDDYALDFCRKFSSNHKRPKPEVFEVPDFDADKFCKFVLAVLWRASISKRRAFASVQLGPYEGVARDILFGSLPLTAISGYEVFLQRYTSTKTDPTAFYFHPLRKQMFGSRAYGIGLAGFQITARLSNQKSPAEFRPFILNGSTTMRGLFVDLHQTAEFAGILKLAQKYRGRVR